MKAYRTIGHGFSGPVVNARAIAGARMVHAIAKRTPAPLTYLGDTNAEKAGAIQWVKVLIKSFKIDLTIE